MKYYTWNEGGVAFTDESDESANEKCLEASETLDLMKRIPDAFRAAIMQMFCRECGDIDSTCQCWNDE